MKKPAVLLIVLILAFFIGKGWWNSQFEAVSSDEHSSPSDKTEKVFVVVKGEGISEIADKLKKDDLIRSPFAFKLYTKQQNLDAKIQPGTFKLNPSMSVATIATTLTNQPLDNWVTLLEGWRVEEMAQKLNKSLGVDQKEFLKLAKEGYMFPDTYLFSKDFSTKQIADRMRANFENKYTDDLQSKIKALGLTPEQGVILASIVEREARSDEVRKMVASILLKRFKISMGLNVDSTIQYALGYQEDEQSFWKRHLTRDDLQVKSAYNTYLHSGFPPTPICNPSLSSLKAVANADPSTPYLYYYHDSKGNSYYAKILEEHNQNVADYP